MFGIFRSLKKILALVALVSAAARFISKHKRGKRIK
jgi:hypothetical protein